MILMNINVDLFYFFNHALQNPVFDWVMPVLTHLGGFKFLLLILIIIILYAHIKKKRTLRRVGILALVALLFSGLITAILKHLIYEPRPFASLDNVRLLITEYDPLSFPSGHTTSTFAVVTYFVLNMKELARRHYKVIDALLIIFAILIPISRMYVGVHYPGDVLAGAIIGIAGACLIYHFRDWILELVGKVK